MPHALAERHPLNGIGRNPLTVTLRYRCECQTNEVIAISAVLDMRMDEAIFIETMRRLRHDVLFEVSQHLRPPTGDGA